MRFRVALALLLLVVVPRPVAGLTTDQIHVGGLLDLTAAGGTRGVALNALNNGDSNFDPYRLRLFLDGVLERGLEAHVQFIAIGENYSVLQYGAYALWTPIAERDLHLEAGFIPWTIGTWAPRTYSNVNVLIGMPMLYQLHSTLSFAEVAPNADALLAAAGSGEFGVDYGNGPLARGVPIVYDRCWDAGVVAIGSQRPFEFSFGFVQGAPSWPQNAHDKSPGKTILGRVGVSPWPALRLGVSGAQGPWLPYSFSGSLPAGMELRDLQQRVVIADGEIQYGHIESRGELYLNEWDTPFVGVLGVKGAWAETKVSVIPGAWLALRGEVRRHSKLSSSSGVRQPWDHDRDRWEGGVGYRASRQTQVKVALQRNIERIPGAASRHDDVYAATVSIAF